MKKLLSIVAICAFAFNVSNAQADTCAYDAVGTTQLSPTLAFLPDGLITSFGLPNFYEDDVYACYYSFTNAGYLYYFPGCDRDGSGLVEAQELLDVYFYVINNPGSHSAPNVIPCQGPQCEDLTNEDFMAGTGTPRPLGAAVVDGACKMIFGNTVPGYVALFANEDECNLSCGGCQDNADCLPEEYCNFDGTDCGATGNGTCEIRAEVCMMIWDPVCGCDGQTHSNSCTVTIAGSSVDYMGECVQP